MPCTDGRDTSSYYDEYASERHKVSVLETKNRLLTAQLCALSNEVLKLQNGREVIDDAEKNGMVDIKSFIKTHTKEDKERIEEKLKKDFSKHELELIKEIIDKM